MYGPVRCWNHSLTTPRIQKGSGGRLLSVTRADGLPKTESPLRAMAGIVLTRSQAQLKYHQVGDIVRPGRFGGAESSQRKLQGGLVLPCQRSQLLPYAITGLKSFSESMALGSPQCRLRY